MDVANVQQMCSCLRNLLKMEQSRQTLTYPKYSLECAEEFKIIADKIKEISTLISELSLSSRKSGPFKKIETKLALNRIGRTISGNADDDKKRAILI